MQAMLAAIKLTPSLPLSFIFPFDFRLRLNVRLLLVQKL